MSQQQEHITQTLLNAQNMEYFAALRALRKEAYAEIERLLAFLDDLDGDPDLEDSADDEPSLGFCRISAGCTADASGGNDTEVDYADDEDNGDGEPSLGAPETVRGAVLPFTLAAQHRSPEGSQEHWADGNRRDLEEEVGQDGREGNSDEDAGYMASRRYQQRLRKRRGQRPLAARPALWEHRS